jgi:hypothetical protein
VSSGGCIEGYGCGDFAGEIFGGFEVCILAYRSGNLGDAVSEVGKSGLPPWGGVGPIPRRLTPRHWCSTQNRSMA